MFVLYIIMTILMIYPIYDTQGRGDTALHRAVWYAKLECAELLILAGADVTIRGHVRSDFQHRFRSQKKSRKHDNLFISG